MIQAPATQAHTHAQGKPQAHLNHTSTTPQARQPFHNLSLCPRQQHDGNRNGLILSPFPPQKMVIVHHHCTSFYFRTCTPNGKPQPLSPTLASPCGPALPTTTFFLALLLLLRVEA